MKCPILGFTVLLILSCLAYCELQNTDELYLKYHGSRIPENRLYIYLNYPVLGKINLKRASHLKIISFTGKILYQEKLEGLVRQSGGSMVVAIPYFGDAEKVAVFRGQQFLYNIYVSGYSNLVLLERYDRELARRVRTILRYKSRFTEG